MTIIYLPFIVLKFAYYIGSKIIPNLSFFSINSIMM